MKFPLHPNHPERVCWGCEKLCPINDMRCGNGTDRAHHPIELFGEGWCELELEHEKQPDLNLIGCPAPNRRDAEALPYLQ